MKRIPLLSILLLGWWLFNILQAGLLSLDPDEAYYWLYAQRLDWGYFDHPPMVALGIRLGYLFFHHELGVRLATTFFLLGTVVLVWKLAGSPRQKGEVALLFLLAGAMPLLHVYGFVATPDAPLLFFSALFFLVYRRFLEKADPGAVVLLGISMAGLLYSKYHGVLLIFFTLLSHLRLLKKPAFYLSSILGFLLFLPHLYWQYLHDFPSFRYHLSGRDDPYELKHTLNYLLNQFLVFSPFLFPLILYMLFRRRPANLLERAFYVVILGFWGFFFYSSFKGHTEPQWTVVLSIPFIVLLFQYAREYPAVSRWVRLLGGASVVLLILARLALLLPGDRLRTPFHQTSWVKGLEAVVDERPVIFVDSYRNAAQFAFYSGRTPFALTDILYRKSQFDIWDDEKALQDKSVWIIGQGSQQLEGSREVKLPRRTFRIKAVDSLQVVQKVTFELPRQDFQWTAGAEVSIPVKLVNPYPHDIHPARGNMPISVDVLFDQPLQHVTTAAAQLKPAPEVWPAGDTLDLQVLFRVPPALNGSYSFALCTQIGDLPVMYNSSLRPVFIR